MKTKTIILVAASIFSSLFVSGQDIMKPIIPQNTLKLVVKQAVAESKAYTDKAVKEGTASSVTSNDLQQVADVANTARDGVISNAVNIINLYVALADKANASNVYTKTETDALLLKITKRLSLLEATVALLGNGGDVVEVNGALNYNDPTKSVAIAGELSAPTGASVTAKNVAMSGVSGTVNPVVTGGAAVGLLVNAESVSIANSSLTGTTQQSSNLIEARGTGTMTIKDTTFTGDTYNTLMTGQRTTEFLKELTIENCVFDENCKHINIWFAGFQDNAVLNIKNCTFKTCEQFLCISDFHGTEARTLTVNIENVNILNYEKNDAYEGIMMVDDRVCTSSEQLRSVNPFSKVTINLNNVTAGGTKLTQANFGIGTGTTGQQLYYYSKNAGGVYPYNETNASLFPTINFAE